MRLETRPLTLVRKVCAANNFAAAGASGDKRRTLHVAQASDYEEGDGGESEVFVGTLDQSKNSIY